MSDGFDEYEHDFPETAMTERAEQAKQEGIDNAEKGAGKAWMAEALKYIELVSIARPDFTSDDLWFVGLPQPPEPRALGAAFRKAARMGLVVATNSFRLSIRVACHRRPLRVWKRRAS